MRTRIDKLTRQIITTLYAMAPRLATWLLVRYVAYRSPTGKPPETQKLPDFAHGIQRYMELIAGEHFSQLQGLISTISTKTAMKRENGKVEITYANGDITTITGINRDNFYPGGFYPNPLANPQAHKSE